MKNYLFFEKIVIFTQNMGTVSDLNTMTCSNCGKKLAEVKMEVGTVSIKCAKCGTINVVAAQSSTTTSGVSK